MSYLTEAERKEKIIHNCEYYQFESCVDLSQGVKIKQIYYRDEDLTKTHPEKLAVDVAQFTIWWTYSFHKKLNGFSGIDTIKFEVIPNKDCVKRAKLSIDEIKSLIFYGDEQNEQGISVPRKKRLDLALSFAFDSLDESRFDKEAIEELFWQRIHALQ
jgi:hypothetical protein